MKKPTERLSSLSKITQLVCDGTRVGTWAARIQDPLCCFYSVFLQESKGALGTSPEIPAPGAESSILGLTLDHL